MFPPGQLAGFKFNSLRITEAEGTSSCFSVPPVYRRRARVKCTILESSSLATPGWIRLDSGLILVALIRIYLDEIDLFWSLQFCASIEIHIPLKLESYHLHATSYLQVVTTSSAVPSLKIKNWWQIRPNLVTYLGLAVLNRQIQALGSRPHQLQQVTN